VEDAEPREGQLPRLIDVAHTNAKSAIESRCRFVRNVARDPSTSAHRVLCLCQHSFDFVECASSKLSFEIFELRRREIAHVVKSDRREERTRHESGPSHAKRVTMMEMKVVTSILFLDQ
jgi:hypothetical protein